MLTHNMRRRLQLFGSDRPGRGGAKGFHPLAQAQIGIVRLGVAIGERELA